MLVNEALPFKAEACGACNLDTHKRNHCESIHNKRLGVVHVTPILLMHVPATSVRLSGNESWKRVPTARLGNHIFPPKHVLPYPGSGSSIRNSITSIKQYRKAVVVWTVHRTCIQ